MGKKMMGYAGKRMRKFCPVCGERMTPGHIPGSGVRGPSEHCTVRRNPSSAEALIKEIKSGRMSIKELALLASAPLGHLTEGQANLVRHRANEAIQGGNFSNRKASARSNPGHPRMSMTFGKMPSKAKWDEHWAAYADRPWYDITVGQGRNAQAADARLGLDGSYDRDELFQKVIDLYNIADAEGDYDGDHSAASYASSIMDSLGFEWV